MNLRCKDLWKNISLARTTFSVFPLWASRQNQDQNCTNVVSRQRSALWQVRSRKQDKIYDEIFPSKKSSGWEI